MDSIQVILGISATSTGSIPMMPTAPMGQTALSRCCGTEPQTDPTLALLRTQTKVMKKMLRLLTKLMKGPKGKRARG